MTIAASEKSAAVTTVTVNLGSRSYPIYIGSGLIALAPPMLAEALPRARFAIVADEAVAPLAETLADGLASKGLLLGRCCYVPSGESSKSFSRLEAVCSALL